MGCSTFSQYTVVSKFSVVTINPKAPLEKACLLGCGITTGYGALTKTSGIEDSIVAVFGIGCVGLSILQGARAKGCKRVFAVDTNPKKEEWAKKFGASESRSRTTPPFISAGVDEVVRRMSADVQADFVNPAELKDKSITQFLIDETDGGCDFTFDATGNVRRLHRSYSGQEHCLRPGGAETIR